MLSKPQTTGLGQVEAGMTCLSKVVRPWWSLAAVREEVAGQESLGTLLAGALQRHFLSRFPMCVERLDCSGRCLLQGEYQTQLETVGEMTGKR